MDCSKTRSTRPLIQVESSKASDNDPTLWTVRKISYRTLPVAKRFKDELVTRPSLSPSPCRSDEFVTVHVCPTHPFNLMSTAYQVGSSWPGFSGLNYLIILCVGKPLALFLLK